MNPMTVPICTVLHLDFQQFKQKMQQKHRAPTLQLQRVRGDERTMNANAMVAVTLLLPLPLRKFKQLLGISITNEK